MATATTPDSAVPAPKLNIPTSDNCVNVSIIDNTSRISAPSSMFIQNPLPGNERWTAVPAFSFLISNWRTSQTVLFDLGVRKDWKNLAPVIVNSTVEARVELKVDDDVAGILEKEGSVRVGDIDAIIWSHWHLDHIGDPSTFPSSTDLVVGPGFKQAHLPGYPKDPNSHVLETDFSGRNVREVDLDAKNGLRVGRYKALDYFGDGSFYLLEAPGHTVGHMCALARTISTTLILMGADTCHHCAEFRPTEYTPLPSELTPSPFSKPAWLAGTVCLGSLLEAIHPRRNVREPFYTDIAPAPDRDLPQMEDTRKMIEFDASEDVFVVIAHDPSLLPIVDFFPALANDWQVKGWKQATQWRFLEDFSQVASGK